MAGGLAAVGVITTTIPMIVATGAIIKVIDATYKKNGKPVGVTHWHYRGKKARSHRHEGGHLKHEHKGLRGFGRTRKSLKK